MDPATLAALYTALYTALATVGLVAVDTYANANTMYLDTTVAHAVQEEGYEPEVVDGIFIAEVKQILKTPTLVAAPTVKSSKTKPVSAALADAAGMESALNAIQGLMGIIPPKLVTSVIAEDMKMTHQVLPGGGQYQVGEDVKLKLVLTGYDAKTGYFDIMVEGHTEDDDFDHLIRDAAFAAVLKLDPYLALLYDVNRRAKAGEDISRSRDMIEKELNDLPGSLYHDHRALLENLRGVMALLENDTAKAREMFKRSIASDPDLPVGHLNLAFLDVHEDKFEDAIKTLEKVIYPTYWPMTSQHVLLASAYTIKGVAETEMEKFKSAEASFQKAAALNPQSSEVFVYWARMLRKSARPAEAQQKLDQARENSVYFENFPETALLYFWLTEEGVQPLDRRESVVQAL
jgi:Tfp pilus assembly protein PilF